MKTFLVSIVVLVGFLMSNNFSMSNVVLPYYFQQDSLIIANQFNADFDTLRVSQNRMKDTIQNNFMRYTSRPSYLRLNTDSLAGYSNNIIYLRSPLQFGNTTINSNVITCDSLVVNHGQFDFPMNYLSATEIDNGVLHTNRITGNDSFTVLMPNIIESNVVSDTNYIKALNVSGESVFDGISGFGAKAQFNRSVQFNDSISSWGTNRFRGVDTFSNTNTFTENTNLKKTTTTDTLCSHKIKCDSITAFHGDTLGIGSTDKATIAYGGLVCRGTLQVKSESNNAARIDSIVSRGGSADSLIFYTGTKKFKLVSY